MSEILTKEQIDFARHVGLPVDDLEAILSDYLSGCANSRTFEACADEIREAGYVKIVLCRDCWKWGKDDCPVYDSWDDDFCCYGEAKEAGE